MIVKLLYEKKRKRGLYNGADNWVNETKRPKRGINVYDIGLLAAVALVVGSFINVVIYRLPRQESLIWPGSHCPTCGHKLPAWQLIPVISYLWLGGRCRFCHRQISMRYILVEIGTVLSFGLIYLEWGFTIESGVGWVLTSILIICAITDLEEGTIPNRITYPGILAGLFLSPHTIGIGSSIQGAIFFAGILLMAALISSGGMGGGDIKLAGLIGAFTGLSGAILTLFLSALGGSLWALLLIWQGKADRKTAIKYGPFLAAAGWLVWIYEGEIFALLEQVLA